MRALILFSLLFVLPVAVSGLTIISVSPAHGSICVPPGSYQSTGFIMYANVTQTTEMFVETFGPSWVIAPSVINVSRQPSTMVVWASPPKKTPEGAYDASINICMGGTVEQNGTTIRGCLQPTLRVNVSSACPAATPNGTDTRDILTDIILLAIASVMAVLAFRMLRRLRKRA